MIRNLLTAVVLVAIVVGTLCYIVLAPIPPHGPPWYVWDSPWWVDAAFILLIAAGFRWLYLAHENE